MRVMVIVKASKDSEAGVMPSEQLLQEMGQFNEELAKAGLILAGEGLQPSSKGVRIQFSGKRRTVIDGPFAETKELIAGFWIWKVNSMAEAIEWVKRCPNPHEEDGEIEIRPIFEAEDFGEAFTPELKLQEAVIRAQSLGLSTPRFVVGPSRLIAGICESYTFESRVNIPRQWERFVPFIGKITGQKGNASYGVSFNCQPGRSFDYLTGVEVADDDQLPAAFRTVQIPAQPYVVFTHLHHVSKIPEAMDTIWRRWLPESGYRASDSPCFELYSEEFCGSTGMGGVEIWIPIEE